MTTTTPADIVDANILIEERWAYERRVDRLTYRAMADLVRQPQELGGLGRVLSTATLVRRANAYLKAMVEEEQETRDSHRARELEALDKQERALYTFLDPIDRAATQRVAGALGMTVDQITERKPGLIVMRDDKVRISALSQLRAVSESRRRLLGLDSPTEASVTITTVDATEQAISELVAQLGLPPTEGVSS